MGFGDALMATGRAKILREADPSLPIAIGDGAAVHWSPVFDNNPRLATPADVDAGRPVRWLIDHPGNRPYVDYDAMQRDAGLEPQPWPARRQAIKMASAWRWRSGFAATAGEIWLTEDERAWARDAVGALGGNRPLLIVEPTVKRGASPNKAWPHWNALAPLRETFRVVQLGPAVANVDTPWLWIETPTFRHACAVLARAAAVILPEGGLHHAAAALGVPGVVIFGGFIAPRTTGYGVHVNLAAGGEMPCGERDACGHCRAAMASIAPGLVMAALGIALGRS